MPTLPALGMVRLRPRLLAAGAIALSCALSAAALDDIGQTGLPGDTGTLTYTISNPSSLGTAFTAAQVLPITTPHLEVLLEESDLGNYVIPDGGQRVFTVRYRIKSTATDGAAGIVLTPLFLVPSQGGEAASIAPTFREASRLATLVVDRSSPTATLTITPTLLPDGSQPDDVVLNIVGEFPSSPIAQSTPPVVNASHLSVNVTDALSGLESARIYKDGALLAESEDSGSTPATFDFDLVDGSLYLMEATDRLGNKTIGHFVADLKLPQAGVVVRTEPQDAEDYAGVNVHSVFVTATDAGGVRDLKLALAGSVNFQTLSEATWASVPTLNPIPFPPGVDRLPPGTKEFLFEFPDLPNGDYVVLAIDQAGQISNTAALSFFDEERSIKVLAPGSGSADCHNALRNEAGAWRITGPGRVGAASASAPLASSHNAGSVVSTWLKSVTAVLAPPPGGTMPQTFELSGTAQEFPDGGRLTLKANAKQPMNPLLSTQGETFDDPPVEVAPGKLLRGTQARIFATVENNLVVSTSPAISRLTAVVQNHVVKILLSGAPDPAQGRYALAPGDDVHVLAQGASGVQVDLTIDHVTAPGEVAVIDLPQNADVLNCPAPEPSPMSAGPGAFELLLTAAGSSSIDLELTLSGAACASPYETQIIHVDGTGSAENIAAPVDRSACKVKARAKSASPFYAILPSGPDGSAPTTVIDSSYTVRDPAGLAIVSPTMSLPFAGTDDSGPVALTEYRLPGGSFQSLDVPLGGATDLHTVEIRSRDGFGNLEVAKSTQIHVDADVPSLSFTTAPYYASRTPTLTAVLADPLAGLSTSALSLSINGEDVPFTPVYQGVGGSPSGVWLTASPLPNPIHFQGFTRLNGRLYSLGGHDGSNNARADVNVAPIGDGGIPGAWVGTEPLPEGRANLIAVPALGRVYAIGGNTPGSFGSQTVYYAAPNQDGTISEWHTAQLPMTIAALSAVSFTASGAHLLAFGGYDGSANTNGQVWSTPLDPQTGEPETWVQQQDLPSSLASSAAFEWNGRVYVVGGSAQNGNPPSQKIYSAAVNNGAITSWTTERDLPLGLWALGAVALQGRLYAFGGIDAGGAVHDEVRSAAILDNGRLDAWRPEPSLIRPLAAFGAVASELGIYIAGGYDGQGIVTETRYTIGEPGTVLLARLSGAPSAPLEDGQYLVAAAGANRVENSAGGSVLFVVDATPPSIALAANGVALSTSETRYLADSTPLLHATFSDGQNEAASGIDPPTVKLFLDGVLVADQVPAPALEASFTPAAPLNTGLHNFKAVAADKAGNGAMLVTDFFIDDVAPEVAFSSPAPGAVYGAAPVELLAALSENLSGLATVSFTVDGASVPATFTAGAAGALGPWTDTDDLLAPIHIQGFALLNGRLYSVGGHDGTSGIRAEASFATLGTDGLPGPWTAMEPLPAPRAELVAVPALGRLYALGGIDGGGGRQDSVYYAAPDENGAINHWETAALPGISAGLAGAAFATSGTDIFAVGGVGGAGAASNEVRVSRLDAETGVPGGWDTLPTGMLANVAQAPSVQTGGRLYILGGFSSDASAINNKVFSAKFEDHALTDWREESPMPLAVRLAGAAALNGKVYAMGGIDGSGVVHAEVYSAVVGGNGILAPWEPEPQSLKTPLGAFGAANSASAVYIAGGYDGAGIVKNVRTSLALPPAVQTATGVVAGLAQGERVARVEAVDRAGNTAWASTTFHMDLSSPVTNVTMDPGRLVGAVFYALPGTPVTLSATDFPAVHAGTGTTFVAVDGGPSEPYVGPLNLAPGTHSLAFYSADLVGNVESTKTATVKLDGTASGPVTTLAAFPASETEVRLVWTVPGDDADLGSIADVEVRADVRASAGDLSFAGAQVVLASGPVAAGQRLTTVIGDLLENTEYFAAVFIRDTAGNWSNASLTASTFTFRLARSDDGVAELASPVEAEVAVVETTSAAAAYTAAVEGQDLTPATEVFYELTEGLVFPPEAPAVLSFEFNPQLIDPAAIRIYTYDPLTDTWSSDSIANQTVTLLDATHAVISGEILHTSLYAPMVSDSAPPLTAFAPTGTHYLLEGRTFVAAPSSGVITAQDQAPTGGTPSGVAASFYSLDAGPEQTYAGAFALAEGRRVVAFRSVDTQGNQETPKTAEVYVDASAPVLEVALDQPTISIPGGFATASATAVLTLSALEPEVDGARAGLAGASYVLDGATVTLPVTPGDATAGTAVPLGTGLHTVAWRAADRVGHAVERSLRVSVGDATLPALSFAFPRADEPGLPRLAQGTVTVRGSASDDLLASWELRAGTVLVGSGTANVSGKLGVWDGAAQSGLVTLKLSALDEGGNAALAELPVYGGTPARVLALGGKSVLSSPRGVAWGPDRIYVADTAKDRIRVFDGAGALVATYGANSGPLKFGQPWGVAVDSAGNIYVADAGKKRVVKLAPDGAFLAEYGGAAMLKKPVAVALVPGKILVADAKAGEIVAFAPEGALLQRVALLDGPLAPPEPEDTSEDVRPMALAADAAGNVWVADARGRQLLKYTPALAWAQTISGFSRPEGVAVTPSGSVVAVSEAKKHRLSTYDAELGARLAVWGEQGSIKENKPLPPELFLKNPAQLAFTAGGNLLVADRGNDMIQGFGLPGTPLVAAMAGGSGGTHLAAFGDEGFGVSALDPDSSFALRDVYAFPNPAVRGEKPTVHVAVGKADKVTVKFYDLAGTPVHEATLDAPAVVNDESGPQWAYEYAWDGHIPSGVYLYAVTAEKAGSAPITRVGKLAVVR